MRYTHNLIKIGLLFFIGFNTLTTLPSRQILGRLEQVNYFANSHDFKIIFKAKNASQSQVFLDKNNQLNIVFPSLNPTDLERTKTIEKITTLFSQSKLLKNNPMLKQDETKTTILIPFNERHTTSGDGGIIIKWSYLPSPERLVVEFMLEKYFNELGQTDPVTHQLSTKKLSSFPSKTRKEWRIIIDPGHGGTDPGARSSSNLLEKDIALKVSKYVQDILKKDNYIVYLTRATDTTISFEERAGLANQLKADLFVSIHVNSSGIHDSPTTGIETHYLSPQGISNAYHQGGYVFVNMQPKNHILQDMNRSLQKKLEQSKHLALRIQTNIIQTLSEKLPFKPQNRGIKENNFKIMLGSNTPTALVELGFLTNRQEALLLGREEYQRLLSFGISKGIKEFINQIK